MGGVQIDDRELKQIKTVICQDLVSATPKNKTVWEDSIICEKTSAFTDWDQGRNSDKLVFKLYKIV